MTIPSIDLDVHISTQVMYAAFYGGTFPQHIFTCGLRITVSATHCSGGMAEWQIQRKHNEKLTCQYCQFLWNARQYKDSDQTDITDMSVCTTT